MKEIASIVGLAGRRKRSRLRRRAAALCVRALIHRLNRRVHMNQTNLHSPSSAAPRVAIVSASWHADLVGRCREAAIRELEAGGPVRVDTFEVPGAFEIPLHAMKLARSGQFDAVLACALVVALFATTCRTRHTLPVRRARRGACLYERILNK